MNIASRNDPQPLSLDDFKKSIERYPDACELVVKRSPDGSNTIVAPNALEDHTIAFFVGRDADEHPRTNSFFAAKLEQRYGEVITKKAFPLLEQRLLSKQPLSARTIKRVLKNAEILACHDQAEEIPATVNNPELEHAKRYYEMLQEEAGTAQKKLAVHYSEETKYNDAVKNLDSTLKEQLPSTVLQQKGSLQKKLMSLREDAISKAEVASMAYCRFVDLKKKMALEQQHSLLKKGASMTFARVSPLAKNNKADYGTFTT